MQFARDTWWDALLAFYSLEKDPSLRHTQTPAITSDQRNTALQHIIADLRALFHSAATWMSFIHLPRFFEQLLDPSRRARMQPCLVLSALALGTLAQSSEVEKGKRGRHRAIKLVDMAHGALQSSLATGWVEVGLAQAASLLLYFEINLHPAQTWEQTHSTMFLLDSLIRLFSLTTIDAGHPSPTGMSGIDAGFHSMPPPALPSNAAAAALVIPTASSTRPTGIGIPPMQQHPQHWESLFAPCGLKQSFFDATAAQSHSSYSAVAHPNAAETVTIPTAATAHSILNSAPRVQRGCNCQLFSMQNAWPTVKELSPTWAEALMWPANLSEAELCKEECRRLVWGSVMMVANMNAYAGIIPSRVAQMRGIFVQEHEHFSLLTPSEMLVSTGMPLQNDDIWSLNLRAMRLLQSCLRVRTCPTMSGAQRAEFAVRAWLQIDDLEERMERHTCGLSTNYGFQSTEMLFSLRLCVSYEFQRFIPQITTAGNVLFYRDKAEAWIRHLSINVEEVNQALRAGEQGGPELGHRKALFVFWFLSGIKTCLTLWEADPTLALALTAACQTAAYLEHFLLVWPSDRT
ncbi:hypothetical protein BN946_scf184270.g2 [Trametes cinnabarina]|uniref:Transcription factor domain-containing protein n=1 Tax=Pycnoporus cinnabarinus TaxID=5643 RepID=A0A060SAU4_PYCCI|nr:hypothetical protein BN946_scf184270.g2 [Trametes cinnabarina]